MQEVDGLFPKFTKVGWVEIKTGKFLSFIWCWIFGTDSRKEVLELPLVNCISCPKNFPREKIPVKIYGKTEVAGKLLAGYVQSLKKNRPKSIQAAVNRTFMSIE